MTHCKECDVVLDIGSGLVCVDCTVTMTCCLVYMEPNRLL